jgi:hypothetical protein
MQQVDTSAELFCNSAAFVQIEEASGTEQIVDSRFQKGEILGSFLLLVSDFCSACHGNATQNGKGSFGGSDC